jgi:2'-5' RNA ligase
MRIFLAVFPPAPVRKAALEVAQSLRTPGDGVSWVKEDNLHYTLRFLGEIGEDGARRAGEAATRAAAKHVRFDAALGAPGVFPPDAPARVLWLGMAEGGAALEALAKSLDEELKLVGFGRADMRFSAHLTIGRVRHPGRDWAARVAEAVAPADMKAARFKVTQLELIESELSPRGSIYTVRGRYPLAE